MSGVHVVREGDHISAVALRNGFGDWHLVWEHGPNAALRKLRAFHHALHPGDEVVIPDKEAKDEPGPTTQVNSFVLDTEPLFLRLRLVDLSGNVLKGTPAFIGLRSNAALEPAPTDGAGISESEVGALVTDGEITATPPGQPVLKFDLKIGSLRDEKSFEGQQGRLNNLGYFSGFGKDNIEQFVWAVEEFLCDLDQVRIRTRPLVDPELGVVDKSGAPDAKFVAKLVKAHGV
jgi:hypothetical protein